MNRLLQITLLLVPLGAAATYADEGRIPIFQPTTITAPGRYVVTRDIDTSAAGTTVLTIAANDVVLDLNGHTLSGPAGCIGFPDVIVVNTSLGAQDVVIRGGHLVRGCAGVFVSGASRVRIRIEQMEIDGSSDTGILISPAETVDILDCHIHDGAANGISISGGSDSFNGRIVDNIVEKVARHGLLLSGLRDGLVQGNLVADFGSAAAAQAGILLSAGAAGWLSGANLVAGNTISSFPSGGAAIDDDGVRIDATSRNNTLQGNVIRKNRFGIWSQADGTRIEGNVASGNQVFGIRIGNAGTGDGNQLDRNQTQFNMGIGACGIQFDNPDGQAYGNTNFGGTSNTAGGRCGFANTDAGHNAFF